MAADCTGTRTRTGRGRRGVRELPRAAAVVSVVVVVVGRSGDSWRVAHVVACDGCDLRKRSHRRTVRL